MRFLNFILSSFPEVFFPMTKGKYMYLYLECKFIKIFNILLILQPSLTNKCIKTPTTTNLHQEIS